jgi:hypothetical protein
MMRIPKAVFDDGVNADDGGIVCHSLEDYKLFLKWAKEKKERTQSREH